MKDQRLEYDLAYACFLLLGGGSLFVLGLFAIAEIVPAGLASVPFSARTLLSPTVLGSLAVALVGGAFALRLRSDRLLGLLTAATLGLGLVASGLLLAGAPGPPSLRLQSALTGGLMVYGLLCLALSLDWFLSRRRTFELALAEALDSRERR
jgi:hypothetical protein